MCFIKLVFLIIISISCYSQGWELTNGPYKRGTNQLYHFDTIYVSPNSGSPSNPSFSADDQLMKWDTVDLPSTCIPVLYKDTFLLIANGNLCRLNYESQQFVLKPYSNNAPNPIAWLDTVGKYLVCTENYNSVCINFWVSQDGHNWTKETNGLPTCTLYLPSFPPIPFQAVSVGHPVILNDKLFIENCGSIYSTDTNSFNWSPLNNSPDTVFHLFTYKNYLFAETSGGKNIYRSSDMGLNWTLVFSDPNYTYSKIVEFRDTLYFYTSKNLFYSADSGLNWINIPEFDNYEIWYMNAFDDFLFITERFSGLHGYNGNDWKTYNDGFFSDVYSIASNDSSLICSNVALAYISQDSGQNWEIAVDTSYGIRFPIGKLSDSYYFTCYDDGVTAIYESTDNGNSWNYFLPNLPVGDYYMTTNNEDKMIMKSGSDVYQSLDNGHTFSDISPNLTTYLYSMTYIDSLIFILGKTSSNNYYLLRSFNDGQTWDLVNVNLLSLFYNLFISSNYSLFMSKTQNGISRSLNMGNSWTACNNGLPPNSTASNFYDYNGNIFVTIALPIGSDYYYKIYISNDNGSFWQDISAGLDSSIVPLSKTVYNDYIYICTHKGVWRKSLNEIVLSDNAYNNNESNDILVYPCPTEGIINVKGNNKYAEISIINSTGSRIIVMKNLSNTFSIDISRFPAGLYFIHMTGENGIVQVEKVVKE